MHGIIDDKCMKSFTKAAKSNRISHKSGTKQSLTVNDFRTCMRPIYWEKITKTSENWL